MINRSPARVPRLRPEQLTDEQRRLYEELLNGPRGQGPQYFELTDADGVLTGPFNAMLASPRVGTVLQRLGVALRYHTDLPDQTRELVILVVAAPSRCSAVPTLGLASIALKGPVRTPSASVSGKN